MTRPKQVICPYCKGTGEVEFSNFSRIFECPLCRGAGATTQEHADEFRRQESQRK